MQPPNDINALYDQGYDLPHAILGGAYEPAREAEWNQLISAFENHASYHSNRMREMPEPEWTQFGHNFWQSTMNQNQYRQGYDVAENIVPFRPATWGGGDIEAVEPDEPDFEDEPPIDEGDQ